MKITTTRWLLAVLFSTGLVALIAGVTLHRTARHNAPRTEDRLLGATNGFPSFPQGVKIVFSDDGRRASAVELCQFTVPHTRMLNGVDAGSIKNPNKEPNWQAAYPLPWEDVAQGEYIGPARTPHVPEYRLRVDDVLEFVYRFTHEEIPEPYRLAVGDEIIVESFPQDDPQAIRRGDLNQGRGAQIQPDGTIRLPLVGTVTVAGRTIDEVETDLEERFRQFFQDPSFTVTPLKTNTKLEDLRSAVDARFGSGGQTRTATVTPDGLVQLVGIASVPAQGLTLDELQAEINERYVQLVGRGVEVTAMLRQRAPRFVWVVGEVLQPGAFEMKQPMTVVQAIGMAQGTLVGGNLREIVIFRRDENWQLMATRLDLRGVYLGRTPYPSDNVWLRDNDIVVVPKGPIQRLDEFINLVFTRGIYGVVPFSGVNVSITNRSTI